MKITIELTMEQLEALRALLEQLKEQDLTHIKLKDE